MPGQGRRKLTEGFCMDRRRRKRRASQRMTARSGTLLATRPGLNTNLRCHRIELTLPRQARVIIDGNSRVIRTLGSGFNTTNGPGSPSPVWSYDPAENEWALEVCSKLIQIYLMPFQP